MIMALFDKVSRKTVINHFHIEYILLRLNELNISQTDEKMKKLCQKIVK